MRPITKVYLVDDDVVTLKLNERTISNSGYVKEVEVFSSPIEALEKISFELESINKEDTIIMFLDIEMPEMKGHTFTDQLSKKHPNLKDKVLIVYLSSHKSIDNVVKALDQNIEFFILKPFTESKLLDVIYSSDFNLSPV